MYPPVISSFIFCINIQGSFRIEVAKETEEKSRECRSFSKRRGEQRAKVGAFVQRRVLHLYGVRESFVERLMCSAKRRNKIKTKRRPGARRERGRPRDKSGNKSDRGGADASKFVPPPFFTVPAPLGDYLY